MNMSNVNFIEHTNKDIYNNKPSKLESNLDLVNCLCVSCDTVWRVHLYSVQIFDLKLIHRLY